MEDIIKSKATKKMSNSWLRNSMHIKGHKLVLKNRGTFKRYSDPKQEQFENEIASVGKMKIKCFFFVTSIRAPCRQNTPKRYVS